ncbi:MAG: hypothetical protein AVDCRST_MAG53-468 [uncultured Solirubrobacteraceae bacterium]|uniref:Uncharacterized protein n=1 Tax=uncultured Solirubrobacteraceae bacterium TaxID=1162706 RepID=A0A6J4RPW4_9ACTN|nr:MAG: hypothetical protein AVDCRST_MAG53-468 [uncultured Solirubrobacteraceae bacterium]
MRPDPAAAQHAPIVVGDRPADGRARGGPPAAHVLQPGARVADGLPRRSLGGAQGGGDLVVGQAAELAHQQGAPLAFGQDTEVGDELVETLAHRVVGGGLHPDTLEHVAHRDAVRVGGARTQERHRLVVRDLEQPGLHHHGLGPGPPERAQRRGERALRRVLRRVGVEQQRAAVAQQRRMVTREECFEGGPVAAGGCAGQNVVVGQPPRPWGASTGQLRFGEGHAARIGGLTSVHEPFRSSRSATPAPPSWGDGEPAEGLLERREQRGVERVVNSGRARRCTSIPASTRSHSRGIIARGFYTMEMMLRLLTALPAVLLTLALVAPMALAGPHDGGEGLIGETDDLMVTKAGFLLIAFFPGFILFMSILQWRLDKRKYARKAAAEVRSKDAAAKGGW